MKSYLAKHSLFAPQISVAPRSDLKISVVIPCFNEPDLIRTLNSLWQCERPQCAVEVVVVINSPENSPPEIVDRTAKTLADATEWIENHTDSKLRFFTLFHQALPAKDAGVGLARKIGMDEAVARFELLQNPLGVIVGYDADSLCDSNYLCEIERHFTENQKTTGCSIHFEHPTEGAEHSPEVYRRIVQYELYLRYYRQALLQIGFPFAFHTIGSSFAVRAAVYAKQGGMNKKKAGEDFYFLQKVIPLGNYTELNTTRVIPSPRPSDRVPFGTGAAIQKLIQDADCEYYTYNPNAFQDLKLFFELKSSFFKTENQNLQLIMAKLPVSVRDYLLENQFETALAEINANSPNLKTFEKRFFLWFNAFRVLKYLNFAHEKHFAKVPVRVAANQWLSLESEISEIELLLVYRKLDIS